MRVPNWEQGVVEEKKLKENLLSSTHPVGRFKALYFATLGYEAATWQTLEKDLKMILDSDDA